MIFVFGFAQPRYYKAQMHCHTTNSDGGYSPQDLAQKYFDAGYEVIMITDHNYMTHEAEVNVPGMLVIQSEEITFSRHMNAFFLNNVILPEADDYSCEMAINDVIEQDALIMLNHYCEGLFTEDSWAVSADEILSWPLLPNMLEIWNTGTETIQTHDDKSIWDAILTAGSVIWGSATDDFHPSVSEALEFNKGWNMIWLDSLCAINVYESLLNGNFYASTGVEISNYEVIDYGTHKIINIESNNADKIAFWGPNHQVLFEVSESFASFTLDSHDFVRIELTKTGFLGMGNKYAWTQPVFFDQTTTGNLCTKSEPNINVYPNPTDNYLNIDYNQFNKEINNIKIVNNLGKVFYQNQQISNYNKQIQLSTDMWAAGDYTIIVELTDKTIVTIKVVVTK